MIAYTLIALTTTLVEVLLLIGFLSICISCVLLALSLSILLLLAGGFEFLKLLDKLFERILYYTSYLYY